MIPTGTGDSLRAWVVYPERADKAPVVVVIHEIFGLTPWIRSVADQLAADGFIAIAPDLLTSKNLPGRLDEGPPSQAATASIRTLDPAIVQRDLDATARYGMALLAAQPKYAVVGFCWGGTTAFQHALHAADLDAAVVYYGGTPPDANFSAIRAPVLGLYGENDNRVNASIPAARDGMTAAGKSFESRIFPAAGHGFLRAQGDTANFAATEQAWPLTIAFLRRHLGA
jgi:carboxymethylenebutenolidase